MDAVSGGGVPSDPRVAEGEAGRSAESLLCASLENAPFGVIVAGTAPDGRCLYVNREFTAITGYTQEDIPTAADWIRRAYPDPGHCGRAASNWRADVDPGAISLDDIHEIVRRDGARRTIQFRASPLREGLIFAVLLDVTDRDRVRREMEVREHAIASCADGIALADLDLRLTYVNPAFLRLWGYTDAAEVLGRSATEMWWDPARAMRVGGELIEKGHWTGELAARRRDGTTVNVLVSASVIRDAHGKAHSLMAWLVDLTERREAERALLTSRSHLAAVIESLPCDFFAMDRAGRYVLQNSVCRERWGDVIGRRAEELDVAPETLALLQGQNARAFAGETVKVEVECEVRGETRVLYNVVHPIRVGGDVEGIMGISIDITDRKRVEEAIRESERKLRSLSDNLPGGLVYQVDTGTDGRERRFTYISGGVATLHEISGPEALEDSMRIYGQIHEEDRLIVAEREKVAIETMTPFCAEVRVTLPSGRTGWRLFTSAPRRLPNGHLIWDGVEIDITERRRSDEERARLREQLNQAQKMESVGRLAGGIAHDFNNMLASILGLAELALDRVDPSDPLGDDLREIRTVAERSAELTRQLLAFARKQTVAPRVIDLNKTVGGMLQMLRRLIGEDIDLSWRPGEGTGHARIDPSQIDQILANLCINARDAIRGVGSITIETSSAVFDDACCAAHDGSLPGEYVLLAVRDDGHGMDAETLAHVFEPFFTTKGPGKGVGLGLATVYGIVRQNNGFIRVSSEPRRGTTFEIFLPRCEEEPAPWSGDGGARPAAPGRRETILLVEDEAKFLDVARKMLEQSGHTVLAAATPSEAIRLAREHPDRIQLLLTDVVMPEMRGPDLAKGILSLCPRAKVIFMSGHAADILGRQSELDEGEHFLQKPFSMGDLTAKVREALAS
ncbi:MAG TPA: PAS domain S-box protein [Verrucomicrobiae bacterium]|nr:PAS domain S-box protein [Verrucomicrobiae bacterium]